MQVFEYGAGGSTLFFARRVSKVIAVEHDPAWAAQVQAALAAEQLGNASIQVVLPEADPAWKGKDPADPASGISTAVAYRGMSFRNYAGVLDRWPDSLFDVIMVDGRARPACVHHALPKVKPGGLLILDNAERPHYQPALVRLREQGWRKLNFSGPGPCVAMFWRTWIWRKPKANA